MDKLLKSSLKRAQLIQCPCCLSILSVQQNAAREVQWWELLDWKTMPETFNKLPQPIQNEIRKRMV